MSSSDDENEPFDASSYGELWERPVAFEVCAVPETDPEYFEWSVRVEWRSPGLWAVKRNSQCLNANGEWEFESSSSNRTKKFVKQFRHDFETAMRLAREAALNVRVGHKQATALMLGEERTRTGLPW